MLLFFHKSCKTICFSPGHAELDCHGPRDASYAPTSTLVTSYERSFTIDKADNAQVSDPGGCTPGSGTASTPEIPMIETPKTSSRKNILFFQQRE